MKAKLGIDVTPHALRRTFKTMLGEIGAPPYVGSAALGHAPGDATASAYDKATYFAERVEYVGRLADRLDVLEVGSERCPAAEAGMTGSQRRTPAVASFMDG